MPQREHQGLLSRNSAELLARTCQVRHDRGGGDAEFAADATDAEPPTQPFETFNLAGRQGQRAAFVVRSCLPALCRHVASSFEFIGATLNPCPTLTDPRVLAPPVFEGGREGMVGWRC